LTVTDTRSTLAAIWRIESARIVAVLARMTRDVGLAEELAQDALVIALEQWPAEGVPQEPGPWLMATAKHRAVDVIRRRATYDRKLQQVGRDVQSSRPTGEVDLDALDDHIGDDLLRLIFTACHPAVPTEGRVALTLRLLAGLMTAEPEVHGLVALMEIQASRIRARVSPAGQPVLLMDQDRGQWDRLLIRRGLAALDRAEEVGGGIGPYALQAAIAACHARAHTPADTDWARIAALYALLAYVSPAPVVELNRAVAVGMAEGAESGLAIVDAIAGEKALRDYPQLPAVRGELLARAGRHDEARAAFVRAAGLTRNAAERELFERRAAELG
jgi:predicted RNA polymerase sigma factor